jgi:DNA integrity scanning protein DisA with diadenylate cyclase activity
MQFGRLQSAGQRVREMTGHSVIEMAEVAKLVGWSTRRARRRLLATGAVEKRGGRFVTTLDRLRCHFPEVWQAVRMARLESEET